MTVEIKTSLDGNILIAEVFADPEDISGAGLWIELFAEAYEKNADGVLIVNYFHTVMSGGDAALVVGNKIKFPTLKAIANYRTYLPKDKKIANMSAFRRIAEQADIEYRTFYDYAEALGWMKNYLAESA